MVVRVGEWKFPGIANLIPTPSTQHRHNPFEYRVVHCTRPQLPVGQDSVQSRAAPSIDVGKGLGLLTRTHLSPLALALTLAVAYVQTFLSPYVSFLHVCTI